MEQPGPPENDLIRDIISKLIRTKRYSELTGNEISLLSSFAGTEHSDRETEPKKTIMSWIWDNLFKFRRYTSVNGLIDLDQIDSVISENKGRGYTGFPGGDILCYSCSRSELAAKVKKTLKAGNLSLFDNHDKIEGALCLAGLAGLKELENDIAGFCQEKTDTEDLGYKFYGSGIRIAAFISLVMLESKIADQIWNTFKSINDKEIRTAVLFFYDVFPGKIPNAERSYLHDLLAEHEHTLVFPDLALEIFKNDPKGLNTIIEKKPCYEIDSEFIWDMICPAVVKNKNKILFQEIIDEGRNNINVLARVLLSMILEKTYWALPQIMKQIEIISPRSTEAEYDSILPCYIITAGVLSENGCVWLRRYFNSANDNIRASAILACAGKENFKPDLIELKRDHNPLTSAAAAFSLALNEGAPLAYINSLVLEMGISGLDHMLPPFLYCMLKSRSLDTPAELTDIWLMSGPFDMDDSASFYGRYPYRLLGWLFPEKRRRPLPEFVSPDDVSEQSIAVLAGIADIRFTGLLKTYLYSVKNPIEAIFALSKLIELEKDELSTETRTLKKIILSEESKPIAFQKDELIYAMIFCIMGNFERKSEIIGGLKDDSEFMETFFRILIENGDQEVSEIALKTITDQPDMRETLLRDVFMTSKIKQGAQLDAISISRMITTNSDKFRSDLLLKLYNSAGNDSSDTSETIQGFGEEDIQLLTFLLGEVSSTVAKTSANALAGNIGKVPWLNDSIKRWFNLKDQAGFPVLLSELATGAAGIIRTEDFLPEMIRIANSADMFTEKGKFLNIIESILKNNPDSKFIMLRADDPDMVLKSYNFDITREFNINMDYAKECARIISIALGKLSDQSFAREHAGKSVTINHENDHIDPFLAQKCLTRGEFEKIAVYLTVTYTEESTGLIFADVMDPEKNDPSVEIVNAILQSKEFAVFTVSWN